MITNINKTNTNPDIVFLQSKGANVIPVTTAEAVVWNEGTAEQPLLMSLREKINNMQSKPNQGGPTYTQGNGIIISDTNQISVDPDYITLQAGKLTFQHIDTLDEVINEGIIYLIEENNEYKEYILVNGVAELLGSVGIDLNLLELKVEAEVAKQTEDLSAQVAKNKTDIETLADTIGNPASDTVEATGIYAEIEKGMTATPTLVEISYNLDLEAFNSIYP